jgi:hypothetical protein
MRLRCLASLVVRRSAELIGARDRGTAGLALAALALVFCVLACSIWVALLAPRAAWAAVDDGGSPEARPCPLGVYDFDLQATLAAIGVPVANSSLQVDGTDARLIGSKLLKPSGECITLVVKIPLFEWSVQGPPGQNASIANGDTLSPTVTVGAPGAYRVRFTACPVKCTLRRGSQSKTVGPSTREVTIDVSAAAPPPPETAPTVPPLSPAQPPLPSHSYDTRKSRCSNGGGFADPEWVTAEPFRGPNDYQLVEGPTTWSRVADLDNFLNHDSEDFEWKVTPDPPYAGLPEPSSLVQMKTEWETGSLPSLFRPTPPPGDASIQPGDRTSVFGYWIFDCGHGESKSGAHDGFKSEIHPPVGVAVQRPRPLRIPPSFRPPGYPNGFGANVWVPGIVTDIWFNRHSGENADCGDTALNQPAHTFLSGCLRQPHPLNRKFTFNVYIPRSPQRRAQELGMQAPPVPLFTGIEKLSGGTGGPEPSVTVRDRDGVTWLEVTVDLSGFADTTYARRLSFAWAYPQPDNWGALRWRVRLRSMNVFDDAEPPFDDGDWRFYFNTNNLDQEWTELFSCDGCVDDDTTYILNVSTGQSGGGNGSNPQKARNLGPDPVVFPNQNILVHTTGYDDEVVGDDVGTVLDRNPQMGGDFSTNGEGGDGSYRINYSVRPLGSVGRATLTPEANALLGAYTGNVGVHCVGAILIAPLLQRICTPEKADPTFARRRTVRLESLAAFENESEERSEHALTGITAARLRHDFNALRPTARRRLLRGIRQELRAVPGRLRGDFNEIVLTLDRALPANVVRRAVPPNVRKSIRRLRHKRQTARRD